jgi:hypothetical protein
MFKTINKMMWEVPLALQLNMLFLLWFYKFKFWLLEFVSSFDIRNSDFPVKKHP